MESNDYRLERWLAILLSLLFFLPFIARADDIVYTESYHGEELPYAGGERFLALTNASVLVPVTMNVTAEQDPFIDQDGEKTGKRVSVTGLEDVFLLRGTNLHPGKVTPAQPGFAELIPRVWQSTFVLGSREYDLAYRCADTECTLVLAHGEITQDLITIEVRRLGREIHAMEVEHSVHFAGDLDHDGRLDLIANLSYHWNEWRPTLWLSSAAKEGELVGLSAELSTTGC